MKNYEVGDVVIGRAVRSRRWVGVVLAIAFAGAVTATGIHTTTSAPGEKPIPLSVKGPGGGAITQK